MEETPAFISMADGKADEDRCRRTDRWRGSPSASRSEHGYNGDASCPSLCWQTLLSTSSCQILCQALGHSRQQGRAGLSMSKVTRGASYLGI